jgi:putative heme-binding domain-containing protein
MKHWSLYTLLVVLTCSAAHADSLELKKGDHICIIGNTLGERMQHYGWLETLLHARFPQHELVVRNLAFSADEVDLSKRLRSMDFGTPDQWLAGSQPVPQGAKVTTPGAVRENRLELTGTKADVIFAFFGFNESFAGEAGLPKFKQDLDAWIKHTLSQKYNGKSAPQIVLFSPIAHEDLGNRNLPNGAESNRRLKLYTAAMQDVAKANKVLFVDLFSTTEKLYGDAADGPCTTNGIHLNHRGDEWVAGIIFHTFFGDGADFGRPALLNKLRSAVLDKNFYWYHRYRTTDGYSTYGDRAFLRFENGQTNYEVLQRELEVLDQMTANRDQRIWAIAASGGRKSPDSENSPPVDDSNTPEFIPVKTNKPGPLPGGLHQFLGGEEAIRKLTVAKNMKVSLFASEEKFPELINPVQMAFDTKGRLWVAAWPTYPHWKPKVEEMNDKLLILEDTDGDGRADKCKTFADKLHNPTGFEFWNGGVLVAMAPDLLFLKDTDGDDKADVRERVLHGLDTADTHHTANSFVLDPGGALYFQEGVFHRTQIETPYGPVRNVDACVWRFEPRTWRVERYVPYGFANPHGHVFDRWGNDFVWDGTGAEPFHTTLFSGHVDYPRKHPKPPKLYNQKTRPCPGVEVLSSRHFPDDMQGDLLVGNVIGFHGILRYKVKEKGASFEGVEAEPVLFSSDQSFRPADFEIGPDGAIWFTDWQNPIIGHMQHNLRDPSRDKTHGRVYRVTYEGRPLVKSPAIAGQPIEKLLDVLKEPEDRVRYRARIELSGHKSEEVLTATKKWVDGLDKNDPNYEHHLLEALWLHQSHNTANTELLARVLRSPDHNARAAATKVLCVWREKLPNALDLLKIQAEDEHPRVRLEAVRACSFFREAKAVEAALAALKKSIDEYIDFTLGLTMNQLEPYWKAAIAKGEPLAADNPAGVNFLLKSVSNAELVKLPRTPLVYHALLSRPQIVPEVRQDALAALAKLNKTDVTTELIDAIERLDRSPSGDSEPALHDLAHLLFGHGGPGGHNHDHGQEGHHHLGDHPLQKHRDRLAKLGGSAQRAFTRQIATVALITADGALDPSWKDAMRAGVPAFIQLLQSVPLIPDAKLRAAAHERVAPLLNEWPAGLQATKTDRAVSGRYVRIELPQRGTLTLAEVQVFSDGRNIAPSGTAKQSTTSHGGEAKRAIDGNTSGDYGSGGQTHTQENDPRPWWELDLVTVKPIEAIVIWNRSEGGGQYAQRLDNFQLTVLDAERREVFKKARNKAPVHSVRFDLPADPALAIRRAAILALVSTGRDQELVFKSLASFIKNGTQRETAVRAIGRLPKQHWPHTEVQPLIDAIVAHVGKVPAKERTTSAIRDELQLGNELANLLPVKRATVVRKTLRELGVPVIVLRPVPHLMIYDRTKVYAEAGKAVEVVFENTDIMPHNLVITRPGALAKVGIAAEAMAGDPLAFQKQFVPSLPEVLFATRMLQPGQSDTLQFAAPSQVGEYPFVCTFPGHWRRMYGTLHVVKSLDDVSPEELAASSTNPVSVTTRPFVRKWQLSELAASLGQLDAGRNLAHGKELFRSIACFQCHKLGGEGGVVGPDLSELKKKLTAKKMTRLDVLTEMVEPSKVIDEKFRVHNLVLTSGKPLSGIVVQQDDKELHLRTYAPDQKEDRVVVIPLKEIDERSPSRVSIMPEGVLNTLTQDEILDLLAYVLSGG